MTRARCVMGKAKEPFARPAEIADTTLGWRFVNPLSEAQYGTDSMAETGENGAEEPQVSRVGQGAVALRSEQRAAASVSAGYFSEEIVPVEIANGKAGTRNVE